MEITGIATLKVGFNKVFGYYIEITQAHKAVELPREFLRKQTTKNAERYVTDELRTFESKVLKAEENSKALEYARDIRVISRLHPKFQARIDNYVAKRDAKKDK